MFLKFRCYKELENHIEKVIELLEEKRCCDDKPILGILSKRYKNILVALKEKLDDVNDSLLSTVKGGTRAYLDAYSDYFDNPLLEELSVCEDIIKKVNNIKHSD